MSATRLVPHDFCPACRTAWGAEYLKRTPNLDRRRADARKLWLDGLAVAGQPPSLDAWGSYLDLEDQAWWSARLLALEFIQPVANKEEAPR